MLVLSRRRGERIIINEDLIIRVDTVRWYDNQVRLCFEGGEQYVIDRYEIYERKLAERFQKAG